MPDSYSYIGPLNLKERTVFSNNQPAPAMHDYRKYSPQALSAQIYRMAETSCVGMSQPHYSKLTHKDYSCICYVRVKLPIIDYTCVYEIK